MRAVLVLCLWVLATGAALFVAWQTKLGPVLLVVSARHGIHAGDVAAFAAAYGWAVVLTAALVRSPGR